MSERLRLGVIFGGRSVEHEVSVVSAQHVMAAADRERFEVVPIGVAKSGVWLSRLQTEAALARREPPFRKRLEAEGEGIAALREGLRQLAEVDVAFPLIHGTQGEDGTLQGLLELASIPYVGCGVAASAVGLDKALMKAVFTAAGLPVAEHAVIASADWEEGPLAAAREVEERLGYPVFVKPANGGSSVGISKARNREELVAGALEAARMDAKLLVEAAVEGREVECAILGNRDAEASPVGEVRYRRDFYDYEAKYLDPATEVIAPTDLPAEVADRVRSMALRAFRAIDGAGLSRVDFFLGRDGCLVIDEINTVPGFTPASMYPRLWEAAGLSYSQLISRLVDLALERYRERRVG
jgi:D-alanine-D-alanine ligase